MKVDGSDGRFYHNNNRFIILFSSMLTLLVNVVVSSITLLCFFAVFDVLDTACHHKRVYKRQFYTFTGIYYTCVCGIKFRQLLI